MSAASSENNFSNYGVYTVTDLLELKLPDTEFRVEELGDSSVNIQVLVWHPREDWSQAQPILLTTIKCALDTAGIEIPFPQRVLWEAKE